MRRDPYITRILLRLLAERPAAANQRDFDVEDLAVEVDAPISPRRAA